MRIFSRIVRRRTNRERWSGISQQISEGLAAVREWWFGACVQAMDGYAAAGASILVNREIDGDLALTLKAYQLLHTSSFMNQHEYIRRSHGREFADLLWAQICGTDLPKVVEILNDVMSPGLTRDGREFRLARLVATHITGDHTALGEAMVLGGLALYYEIGNAMVMSEAFGDQKTTAALREILDGWEEQFMKYVQNLVHSVTKADVAA